jgi:GDPmannose 4,6-dehydratase
MLQQDEPDDYVIATGETHSVEEFIVEAFEEIGIWKNFVEFDKSLERPSEVPFLRGCVQKAKDKLGWEPKIKFKDLVKLMVEDAS